MNILATAYPIHTQINKGKKGELSFSFIEPVVNMMYPNTDTHANTIRTPSKVNIDPNTPTIANLAGFLTISTKASRADLQKFLPLIAI